MKNETEQKERSSGHGAQDGGVEPTATALAGNPSSYISVCAREKVLASVFLGVFTLAAMAFVTFFDMTRFNIALTDEVGYMTAGLGHMDDQWNIYSFPLHSLTYSFTGLFEADPVRIYQLNAFVPFYILVFLLQLHILRQTGSALLAVLLVAPLLLATELGVRAWPHANQTVCIIFLAGLLLAPRQSSLIRMACHLTLLYFLVGFARAEQILSLYLMLLIAGCWSLLWFLKCRDWRAWGQKFAWPLFFAIALIVCMSATMGKPVLLDKHRSLVAFYQHFAYSLWLHTDDAADPWTESESVFEEYFGDANSISDALFHNSQAFFDHLLSNQIYLVSWAINSDPVGATGWILALALYLFSVWRLGRSLIVRWRAGLGEDSDLWRLLVGIAPIPTLLMLAIIFPRTNYLQMSYVLLVASSLVIFDFSDFTARFRGSAAGGFATVAAVGVLTLLQPLPKSMDQVVEVIETVRRDAVNQQYGELHVATTTNICGFFTIPCFQRHFEYSEEKFEETSQEGPLDYVIAFRHPDRPNHGEDLDNYFNQLTESGGTKEWIALPAPTGWNVLGRNR